MTPAVRGKPDGDDSALDLTPPPTPADAAMVTALSCEVQSLEAEASAAVASAAAAAAGAASDAAQIHAAEMAELRVSANDVVAAAEAEADAARMHAASQATELRLLRAERGEAAALHAELDELRRREAARERTRRKEGVRAQQVAARHAAATHALASERAAHKQQRRVAAARRCVGFVSERDGLATLRSFQAWAAHLGNTDAAVRAGGAAAGGAAGPTTPAASHAARAELDGSDHQPGTFPDRDRGAGPSRAHRQALRARDAECLRLRAEVAELEQRVAVEEELEQALARAAQRAANATSELLAARRQQAALAAELSQTRQELTVARCLADSAATAAWGQCDRAHGAAAAAAPARLDVAAEDTAPEAATQPLPGGVEGRDGLSQLPHPAPDPGEPAWRVPGRWDRETARTSDTRL